MPRDSNAHGSRRQVLKAVTAGSVAGLSGIAGCVGDPEEADAGDGDDDEFETVQFGILEPLTGEFSDLAQEHLQGTELGIEHVNESDEYDFTIEYDDYDTQVDPATATREAESAVQSDGAQFLSGCINSSAALAINDFAQQNEVVYAPGAADVSITGEECNEYVFRFETSAAQIAEVMAQWTIDELGDQIFYHIADYAYGESVLNQVESRMESISDSYEQVDITRSDPGSTDFEAFISQISDASDEADALVVGMTGADLALFLSQASARDLQDEIPIVTTTGSFHAVRAGAGDGAYDVYSGVRYVPDLETGDNQAFVEAYESEYGDPPDNFSRVGYESIRMLANGIQEAGSRDPTTVRETLSGMEHDTIFGPNEFRECDQQAVNPVWMGECVEPDDGELADVELLAELSGEEAIPDCEDTNCGL
ncbi:ABC transporter substrate-binding protein [Natronobacterium texcoconense]|uniref:Amino acid/amide ABC transporter substrate-binding protein, HAAT family n=1 Tax=Natronobacterium texcoconense TaxID=1095778 RepID=A0A1H0Z4I4_NATTX|nr:ABC transporter substrate-binding protein [Natronobacterium texcoconense]SDQ22355.1 amino acid/amide ABC transporter substrate-binding protein, HAAT family [Natronobacterium texcoconense]